MSIDKNKKRVIITIYKDKYKELKKIAIDSDTTLSELLVKNFTNVNPFKVYYLTHSLLSDFHERGGLYSTFAEEELFLDLYDLEKEELDIEVFLDRIETNFGLGKKNLKSAYTRFLDYVKYK